MTLNKTYPWTLLLALTGCPDGAVQPGESGSTGTTEGAPDTSTATDAVTLATTTGTPTTDTPTTGTSTSTGEPTTTDTTTEPTTGGEGSTVRVLYHRHVVQDDLPKVAALRRVDIVDGVPTPPVTVLDPPGPVLVTLDAKYRGRWSPYYTPASDAPQLWLLDLETMTTHEVALPPAVERVVTVRLSREDKHLIVWGAPQGSSDGADYTYYLCELGPAGECTLAAVEAATGPTTYVEGILDISSTSGRIWYSTREIDGTARTVLQGDVAAPEAASTLAEFPNGEGGLSFVSDDEKTAYFSKNDDAEVEAMDIASDPPGPPVSLHPPLPGVRHRWSDDGKDLLLHVGDGLWGDLFHLTVDGTQAGSMVQIDAGGASHVFAKDLQWISGRRVLFLGDLETPMANALFVADAAAPSDPPVKLSGPLQAGGKVNNAYMRGDPGHVVYFAQGTDKAPMEIFRARIEPPGETHKLNGPLAAGTSLLSGAFDVSADGARVVYAGSEIAGRVDLFLVDIAGETPAAPINLTSTLPPGIDVYLLGDLSPAADQVFFRGRGNDKLDKLAGPLFMVPLSPEVGAPVQVSEADEPVSGFEVLTAK